ncbi:MAG: transcriptional regulator [Methanomicrobiaceae archaeon]|nr:transcriptional regulator [Methanomicrobiaceae archaeon]
MSQERLLQMVISVLIMADFEVSDRCDIRPRSFDLVSKRGDLILIIKVVSHIDSVSEDVASDLSLIAWHLRGSPLIIGEKTRDAELERGAVYLRNGINAMNVATLYDDLVEGIPPLVYASPGGLYVNIDGELLRSLRERHQMSLGDLAHLLGVSRRTISKYESGMGTTLDIAIKLEGIFDTAVVEALDPFRYEKTPSERVSPEPETCLRDLERMGIELHAMQRAPFQALAMYHEETILTGYGPAQKIVRRAALIGNISEITSTRAMCVIKNYHKQKKVGKTLVIGEDTLHTLEDGTELIQLIDE